MMQADEKHGILVVDDDRRLCRFLDTFLTSEGYRVRCANDGRAMRRALADDGFDLIILDLTFPSGEDGVSLATNLRGQYDLPLIMLSGKNSTIDKVVCLEMGADDYVTKPFEPRELLARIRSVLRRVARRVTTAAPEDRAGDAAICFSGWRLDPSRYHLSSPSGGEVRLTSQEFQLLAALAERAGRILSREQILDIIANRSWTPYDRSIDVLIGKIRRKLRQDDDPTPAPEFIRTIRGVGYMFVPPSEH